jgi:hypothetical protein
VTKDGGIYVRWLCKCDCGNEVIVLGNSLKNNATKSCGCIGTKSYREGEIAYNQQGSRMKVTKIHKKR